MIHKTCILKSDIFSAVSSLQLRKSICLFSDRPHLCFLGVKLQHSVSPLPAVTPHRVDLQKEEDIGATAKNVLVKIHGAWLYFSKWTNNIDKEDNVYVSFNIETTLLDIKGLLEVVLTCAEKYDDVKNEISNKQRILKVIFVKAR